MHFSNTKKCGKCDKCQGTILHILHHILWMTEEKKNENICDKTEKVIECNITVRDLLKAECDNNLILHRYCDK